MEKRKILKAIGMLAGIGLLMALNSTVYGQEDNELMMRRGATTDELTDALRSIRRPNVEGAASTPLAERSYAAIRIHFAYGSAELTPEAKAELSGLGRALSASEFKSATWAIEGHTDAAGSAEYNQQLSERRARAVYNYLIEEFDVSRDQIVPIGKGETELYDKANPLSGKNRRVRVGHIGG